MKIQAEDAVARAMDWLAQLREESAEPPRDAGGNSAAAPPATDSPGDEALAAMPPVPVPAEAEPLAPLPPVPAPCTAAVPPAATPAAAATPPADVQPSAAEPPAEVSPADQVYRRVHTSTGVEITERAAIGDELRIPIAWCEMGSCISHHEDPVALGEADIRARAIETGWRVDALGRLACPKCQQSDSWFWTAHPVALWDRDTAVTMTSLMARVVREHATPRLEQR
jgi:hypothetical protein